MYQMVKKNRHNNRSVWNI